MLLCCISLLTTWMRLCARRSDFGNVELAVREPSDREGAALREEIDEFLMVLQHPVRGGYAGDVHVRMYDRERSRDALLFQ